MTDPSGNVTTNCYYWETSTCASGAPANGGDPTGLYSTTTPPTQADSGGIVTSYTYLPGGSTSTVTTPSGTTTDTYDANGDLHAKNYSNVASGYSATPNVTYSYYPDGSKETMADGTGTTTYNYDANGDLTSQALAAGAGTGLTSNTVSYGYFTTGVRQTVTYPQSGSSSPSATYTYDASGQMASVTDSNAKTTTFAHNPDNDLTSTAFPTSNGVTTTYGYNADDAMTSTSTGPTNPPGSPIAQTSSPRDPSDLVRSETDTGALSNSSTYQYDPAARLNTVNGTTINYSPSGQAGTAPSGGAQSYDHLGAVTSGGASSGTYTNDSLGDRTALSTGGTTYSYNQSGELSSTLAPSPEYTPIQPTRVCDTRSNSNSTQCVGKTRGPNSTLNVSLSGTGLPVPSNATAVVLNLTGIDESGGNGTYLQVYAYGTTPAHHLQPQPDRRGHGQQSSHDRRRTQLGAGRDHDLQQHRYRGLLGGRRGLLHGNHQWLHLRTAHAEPDL